MSYTQHIDTTRLKKLQKRSPKIFGQALDTTAENISGDAKELITREGAVDTGDLRGSIHPEGGAGMRREMFDVSIRPSERIVGSNKAHAAIVEFGGEIPVTKRSHRYFQYMAISGWKTLNAARSEYRNPGFWWKMFGLPIGYRIKRDEHSFLRPAFHQNRKTLGKALRRLFKKY